MFREHLPWLVPLLLVLLSGGAQIYALIGRVDTIETRQNSSAKTDLVLLHDLKYRIETIERFCCEDKISDEPINYSSVATTSK